MCVVSVVVAAVYGCSGTMQGIVQPGRITATFYFEETGMGHGTLRTTLPDGERCQVKHVYQSSTAFGTGYGTARSGPATASASSFSMVEAYSRNVEAVLFGDRSHTLKCRFRVADTFTGMTSGGIGVCQVSEGRVIDVQF